MSDQQYDIRISESCVDPNPSMVKRQDPDNFPRLQTRERCALEIAAYVFKCGACSKFLHFILNDKQSLFPAKFWLSGHFSQQKFWLTDYISNLKFGLKIKLSCLFFLK